MNFHPIENSSDTAKVCVPILIDRYRPRSIMDLGCNVGWWLRWFAHHGIHDVVGIDGNNMINELKIPADKFLPHDLTNRLILDRRFDLVLCLEVAEHLEERYADALVDTCINHSDTIFWSAADPGQGGYHHVNEQPAEYWIEKFDKKGYSAKRLNDILPQLPHDYYRKNAIEFIKI